MISDKFIPIDGQVWCKRCGCPVHSDFAHTHLTFHEDIDKLKTDVREMRNKIWVRK